MDKVPLTEEEEGDGEGEGGGGCAVPQPLAGKPGCPFTPIVPAGRVLARGQGEGLHHGMWALSDSCGGHYRARGDPRTL